MTDTIAPELITEALTLIDRGLTDVQHRSLVSADEVADLLLDVRMILATPPVIEETDPEPVPAG